MTKFEITLYAVQLCEVEGDYSILQPNAWQGSKEHDQ